MSSEVVYNNVNKNNIVPLQCMYIKKIKQGVDNKMQSGLLDYRLCLS